jgi:hypothetical protein
LVRFFEQKNCGYYVVHGEDAFFIAQEYNKTLVTVRYLGSGKLATQSVSPAQFESKTRSVWSI